MRLSDRAHLYLYGPLFTLLLTLLWITWIVFTHETRKDHYLSPDLVDFGFTFGTGERIHLPSQEISAICRNNGFHVFDHGSKHPRKVYDLVLLSTELDWLEIRLHTLSPYVDYFVVVESNTTFTSKPKPLYLQDHWERFSVFHDKIIHKVVYDPIRSERIWDHEDWFRNSMLKEVFPGLVGTDQEAHVGDVLVVSDMDELVRPGAMAVLKYCDIPSRLTLRVEFYYYSFQWRHHGAEWPHPDATVFQGVGNSLPPNALRVGELGRGWVPFAALSRWWQRETLWNAGWHCSSCFKSVEEMRIKMESFSHVGYNTKENRGKEVMMERVRSGLDLFGRENEKYDRIENNQDVPEYVLRQYKEEGRFGYMLNRDGESAGFEDWETVMEEEADQEEAVS